MSKIFSVLFMSLILMASSAFGADEYQILGLWSTAGNNSRVEIFKCGNNYCGKLAELKNPNYPADDKGGMAGQPKVDRLNPDPNLKTRPLLGLRMLEGFGYSGGNVWKGGTIYDPDNGKTYKCKMTLTDPKRLEVRGFIGISWLGRTVIWTRPDEGST
jgi:uncharacterized protein (DUF2147 family)